MTTLGAAESPAADQLRRVRSHRLARLMPDDAQAAMRSAVGHEAPAVWAAACAEVGVEADRDVLTGEEMAALTAALARRPGVVGLTGRALRTRVSTFDLLARQYAGVPATEWDWARTSMDLLLRNRLQDPARTAELARLDLFSDEARRRFARTARRAAAQLGHPLGMVTAVLDGAQVYLGTHGLHGWAERAGGSPVEWSFCATVVRTGKPYVVPDMTADVLQRTNPVVVHDGVGSYAGVPLRTSTGQVLGAVCVLDTGPREHSQGNLDVLAALARKVMTEVEEQSRRAG